MTLCLIFVLSSSSELSERAVARSCYNKGQSSGALRSVRISFTCFSTRSDPRSRVGQMGRGPVLIDEWRQDTARNTHLPVLSQTADAHVLMDAHALLATARSCKICIFKISI